MSKYLKPGPSRYCKSVTVNSSQVSTRQPNSSGAHVKKTTGHGDSGYTEQDWQLFGKLAGSVPNSANKPFEGPEPDTYQTPYTGQDAELFNQLHPDERPTRTSLEPD